MENAIGQLLEEAGKILADRKQETQSGKCFNCVDICGVGTIETRHTEIIAALLDPQGNHGFCAPLTFSKNALGKTLIFIFQKSPAGVS